MNKIRFGNFIKCLFIAIAFIYGINKLTMPVYAIENDDIPQETATAFDENQKIEDELLNKEEKPATVPSVQEEPVSNTTKGDSSQTPKEEDKKEDTNTSNKSSPSGVLDESPNDKNESSNNIDNNDLKPDQEEEQDVLDADLSKKGGSNNNDLDTPTDGDSNESDNNQDATPNNIDNNDNNQDVTPNNIDNNNDNNNNDNNEGTTPGDGGLLGGGNIVHDIADFITKVTISTAQNEQGQYIVKPGVKYDVTMYFEETHNNQFPNDGILQYRLPAGFQKDLIEDGGTFSINVLTHDGTVTVKNNNFTIENGILTIRWSEDDNVGKLFAASNAKFHIRFRGYFDGTKEVIEYNDSVVTPLKFDDTESSLEMEKKTVSTSISNSAYTDSTISYAITLNSTGVNDNVHITDTLSGNGVKIDPSSFKVESNEKINYEIHVDEATNSFTFDANRLIDGQNVTITYNAILDEKFAVRNDQDVFVIKANNKAVLKREGHTDVEKDTEDKITIKPSIQKVGTIVDENTIKWVINVNVDNKLLIKDMPVIDSIKPSSQSSMTYSGTGLIVKIYNNKGQLIETKNVPWEQLTSFARNGWTYTIPTNDDCYRYEIEYTTDYVNTDDTDKVLENDVHFGDNETSSGVYIQGDSNIDLEKKVKEVDVEGGTVTWEIVIHVPKVGLDSTNNVLTERYPSAYLPSKSKVVYEKIVDGSIQVTGLFDNESYTFNPGTDSAIFTFYKDGQPGLSSSSYTRDIKIILKTIIDEDWLAEVDSELRFIDHTNTAIMVKTETETAKVSLPLIRKSLDNIEGNPSKTVTINGEEYPVYKYTALVGLIEEDAFQLNDTFDTSIFSMYIPENPYDDYLAIHGGNSIYYQENLVGGWGNFQRIDYITTATGIKFLITPDKLPKDANGNLYAFNSFSYYLIPKNLSALRELMQKAATSEGSMYIFNNTISYKDELDASVEGHYSYQSFTKKLTGYNDDKTVAYYEIVINPDELVLNEMGTITLIDTIDNLSIIYDSIEVTPSDGVIYDSSEGALKFTLPDAKKITIKYSARVLYVLDENDSATVTTKNTAVLIAGRISTEEVVSDEVVIQSDGSGEAVVYNINLIKYEAGNMTKRLAGAVFELFELIDGELKNILDKNGNKVSFTSDSNGVILIEGDQEVDGWSLETNTRYYLREILAPKGYKIAKFDYSFMIAGDGQTANYGEYIYLDDDILTAKNYPGTDIYVDKEWEDGVENHLEDEVTVKLQERIGDSEEWVDSKVEDIKLSESNNWHGGFEELPLVVTIDDVDLPIEYRIIETHVNDKPVTEDSYILITNDEKHNFFIIKNKAEYTTKGEVTISGLKVLNGKKMKAGMFTFELVYGEKVIGVAQNDEDGHFEFDKIEYTEADLDTDDDGNFVETIKYYSIREVVGQIAGVVYDETVHEIKVTLNDDEQGNIVTEKDPEDIEIVFENNYESKGEVVISVGKDLVGRDWTTNDEFEFTLMANDNAPLPTTTTITITKDSKNYMESFETIEFTKAGTYSYTIIETHHGETIDGVAYDSQRRIVKFTLIDDGEGNLIPDPDQNNIMTVTFTNEYSAEGEVELFVGKELIGRDWKDDDEFKFTITASEGTPLPQETEVIITKNSENYIVSFGKITFTKAGTYTYTVKETHSGETIDGLVYDSEEKTIKFTLIDDGKGNLIPDPEEDNIMTVSFVNEYFGHVSVSKVDVADGEEIEGATIQLLDSEGNVVDEWTSNGKTHVVDGLNTEETYTLVEIVAPDGYIITSEITFSFDEEGNVVTESTTTTDEDGNTVILIENEKTKVSVSKVDIADGKELEGATIQIIDSEGNVVEEWTSTTEAHVIEGLKVGEEYTLKETVAPDGYTITSETTFTIDEEGNVTSTGTTTTDEDGNTVLLVEDQITKVRVTKVDITSKEELEGATLQILDEAKEVVEEWVSTKEAHVIEGLKTGEEYTLKETVAPDGYIITSEITFVIDEDGNVVTRGTTTTDEDGNTVILVEDDIDSIPEFDKKIKDTNDSTGETSDWQDSADYDIGDDVPYRLRAILAENVTSYLKYFIKFNDILEDSLTFKEVTKVTVNGEEVNDYELTSADHNFELTLTWGDGVTKIVDETLNKALVEVFFTAVLNENAVLGSHGNLNTAYLEFSNNPKNIDSKDRSEDDFVIVFTYKTVINKEDVDGNALTGAEFKLEKELADGTKQEVASNISSNGSTFTFNGLDDGNYILTETKAPDGYKPIDPIKFEVTAEHDIIFEDMDNREIVLSELSGNVTSGEIQFEKDETEGVLTGVVKNEKTKVSVSKVDVADGKEIEGATIQIIDSEGKVVEEWISTTEPHIVEGLNIDEEYTLRETVAPDGYKITSETTFTIAEDGTVTSTGTTTTDEEGNTVLLVEDEKTKVRVSKVDIANGEELEGATIQIIDSEGNVVEEWVSTKKAYIIEGLKVNEEYTLRETIAPDGYTITTDTTFTIDEEGNVTSTGTTTTDDEGNTVLLVEDQITRVSVSKVDIADGEEIEGATIQILDEAKEVVEEWVSNGKAHVIEGLKTGVEYTLKETVAPEGYLITLETTFTIDETGKVTSTGTTTTDEDGNTVLLVEDQITKVSISKVDIADGEEIEGATIQIIDKDGNVVEEWVSTKEAHIIEGLKVNEEYTLRETIAPDGYTITSDTTFTIDEEGNVTSTGTITTDDEGNTVLLVEDEKTIVRVSKVDIADGKELEGATIQILDEAKEVVEEWVSTKDVHIIEGLKTGVEYTLKETVAPGGYLITSEITFTIDETGKVTTTGSVTTDEDGNAVILVEDEKKPVKVSVSKVDITSKEELEGATIQLLDKDGKVVEEWVSTKEAHVIEGLNVNEEYTLRETIAPEGYKLTSDTTFTIDDEGNVITEGTTTTDEDGNTIILIEDEKTKVSITKVDIESGEELEGATIQIIDKDGNVVDEWVSTKEAHIIEGLKVNEEYTIKEIAAPKGYKITSETTFIIDENGNVTTTGSTAIDAEGKTIILVQDQKIPTPDNPPTADYFDLYLMLFILFITGFASGVVYLYKFN